MIVSGRMLFKVALGVCSIRVLSKNHSDPYYEPTIMVHDKNRLRHLWSNKLVEGVLEHWNKLL